ncbi:MAG TPA: hypothetical protein VLG12_02780 [Candidatus Saccharimonadales bacterium]|nr:hypothetical protein [Candidatus Saccharimonadales bacterium]
MTAGAPATASPVSTPVSSVEGAPAPTESTSPGGAVDAKSPSLAPGEAKLLTEFFHLDLKGNPTGPIDTQMLEAFASGKQPIKPIDVNNVKLAVPAVDISTVDGAREQYQAVLAQDNSDNVIRRIQQRIADRVKIGLQAVTTPGQAVDTSPSAIAKEEWRNFAQLNRSVAEQHAAKIPLLQKVLTELDAEAAQVQAPSLPNTSEAETQPQNKKTYTENLQAASLLIADGIVDTEFRANYDSINGRNIQESLKEHMIQQEVLNYYFRQATSDVKERKFSETISKDSALYDQILLEKIYQAKVNKRVLDNSAVEQLATEALRDYKVIKTLEGKQQTIEAQELVKAIRENLQEVPDKINADPNLTQTDKENIKKVAEATRAYMEEKNPEEQKKQMLSLLQILTALGLIAVSQVVGMGEN